MWKRTFSKEYTGVDPNTIWRLWTDINNWPTWHDDLDSCEIKGPFTVGNHFFLKPKGMRPVKILLTDIQPGKEFTDCTTFLGAKMYDTHAMESTSKGVRLTNTVVVTGPLKWIWIKLVAQNVAQSSEDHTEALVKLARQK